MSWVGVVTNAGRDLFNTFIASGIAININAVKTGSGTVSTASMKESTELVSQVTTGSIVERRIFNDGVQIKMDIRPYTSSYTLKEVGLFATVTNGGQTSQVLVALLQNSDGVLIPTTAEFPDYHLILAIMIEVDNDDNLSITVDSSTALLSFQGTENAGKFMVVANNGFVVPVEVPFAEGAVF